MLEVYTIGGGEYVVNVLNAVAAWSGSGGFRGLIQVVLVMGLAYSLVVTAFSLDWRAWFNWFLQTTMIYGMLMVPSVTVKVTDRIDPSLAPAVVANVPLGLGIMASFTSQIGDYLTRTAETVFVMPDALSLNTNGIVYGARLFEKAQTFQITNSEFRANLEEHIKQCTFYDVMLGFKSMDQLMRAPDLWAAIGPGSPARGQKWINAAADGTSTSEVLTCDQAYSELDAVYDAQVENDMLPFAKTAFPKVANALALEKLKADLPIAANQLHGSSATNAIKYLRQVSMIDAFRSARESFSAADWDAYASQRAEAQARNTYTSIAQQAMTWVPVLNVVLTVVFYAMFIVVFPLFLFPRTGVPTLKGYATGFFYLASWGPLYVVLHMFVMNRAADAVAAVAPGGPTLLVTDGIQAVNNDIATVAGFLMMSVPFIAAGMAKGALAISGQATSMLAPAQNAAEAAAVERTTGNYAYGNTSFANTTANMMQANKWDTTPTFNSGFASSAFTRADGIVDRTMSDGSLTTDSRGAMSYLPNRIDSRTSASWSLSQSISDEQSNLASIQQRRVSTDSVSARRAHATTGTTTTSRGSETSSGDQSGTSKEVHTGADLSYGTRAEKSVVAQRGTSTSDSSASQSSVSDSASKTEGTDSRFQGTIGGQVGYGRGGGGSGDGGKKGFSAGITGGLSQTWGSYEDDKDTHTTTEETTRRQAADRHQSVNANDSLALSADQRRTAGTRDSANEGTYTRDGVYTRDDRSNSVSDTNEQTFTSAEEKQQATQASQDRINRLSRLKSMVESGEVQVSGDISTPVAALYQQYRSEHPNELLPDVADPTVDGMQNALRERKLQQLAMEYLRPTLEARAAGPEIENDLQLGPMPSVPGAGMPSVPRPVGSPMGRSFFSEPSGQRGYDGRSDAGEHGMGLKPGARVERLNARMAPVIDVVAEEAERMGLTPRTITSGDDGKHLPNSRHYDGQGLDFRGRDLSVSEGRALATQVQGRLGSGYRAEFEVFPDHPERNHLHVQTAGRR